MIRDGLYSFDVPVLGMSGDALPPTGEGFRSGALICAMLGKLEKYDAVLNVTMTRAAKSSIGVAGIGGFCLILTTIHLPRERAGVFVIFNH